MTFAFWKNITIARRMQLAGAIMLSLIAVMIIFNWFTFHRISHIHSSALYMERGATYLQLMLRGVNESAFTQGASASVKSAKEGIAGFENVRQELLISSQDTPIIQDFLVGEWEKQWETLKPKIEKFLSESDKVDFEDVPQMVEIGKLIASAGKAADEISVFAAKITDIAAVEQSSAEKRMFLWMLGIIVSIVTIFIVLSRSITEPIKIMERIIVTVEKSSDLTQIIPETGKDELQHIAQAINRMLQNFRKILNDVSEVMIKLLNATQELRQVADRTSNGASKQNTEAAALVDAMSQMHHSVISISENADQTATEVGRAKEQSDHGRVVISGAAKSISALAENVKKSSEVVHELNNRAEQIGQVLEVIRGIADQTNLLALNAAIEAARAGEQGRGFAVVADEVRTLATRTQTSTAEIQEIIHQLQTGAESAVKAMEQGQAYSTTTVNDAEKALTAMDSIVITVNTIAESSKRIAKITEEQSATANSVNKNVSGISQISDQTSTRAGEAAALSAEIEAMAHRLKSEVIKFKI